jgi:hypothetical protein
VTEGFSAISCAPARGRYDRVHLGLLDLRVTGTDDPLTGTNDLRTRAFTFALPDGRRPTVRGFGSFGRPWAAPTCSSRASTACGGSGRSRPQREGVYRTAETGG